MSTQASLLLKKYFGYDSFRPLQEEVVKTVMTNTDVLLLMPTGGGKSICFQLPALMKEGTAIVISPLIALMKDQVEALKANGISAEFINSSLNYADEAAIINRCKQQELKLLYISPERAIAIKDSLLNDFKISMVAIDEAHCISSWGHDFRPEYQQLKFLKEKFHDVPFIALTATADKITRRDIVKQLGLENPSVYISSFDRPNLSLTVSKHSKEKEKMEDILALINRHPGDSGIIYCLSRKGTEHVADKLKQKGISCSHYHAGMSSEDRSAVQEAFTKDEINVICATIAFGMGIDKSNVRYVVHYNLPKNIEGYYQEIGRAGRDGLPSETILYYSLRDIILLRDFAQQSGQRELNLEKLKLIQHYAEAGICRRKILLNYFSESMTANCGNCDVCLHPPKYIDGTVIAQKALSALTRMNEKAGFTMLINVLRGSRNADVLQHGFDKIKTYGAGHDLSFADWQSYLLQMQQLGLIEIAYDENYTLKVTTFGKLILEGKSDIHFVQPEMYKPLVKEKKAIAAEPELQKNSVLFEKLRKLRKLIADSEGLAPYQVFSDSTLMAMVHSLPSTNLEMKNISGVSQKKLDRYGVDFMKIIIEYMAATGITQKVDVEQMLSDEQLKLFIEEMKEKHVRLSHFALGKILLGSERTGMDEVGFTLSFFGALKNITKYTAIRPRLSAYFEKNIYTAITQQLDTFFFPPVYNHLQQNEKGSLIESVQKFPIEKPTASITNQHIAELRKTYPRSHEPWKEKEIKLFHETVEQTNDIDFLSQTFQRSPNSIKAAYENMIKNRGAVAE